MNKRIIVVEDDASITEVLTLILEGENYKVESFVNNSFVAGLEQDMPGLILLDMWLSGVNGKTICLSLKKDNLLRKIPVVMMSANRDVQQHAEEVQADGYLAKPFDVGVLLSLVKKYME